MNKAFKIGDIVGKNNALLITSFIRKNQEGNKDHLYEVECQICKLDGELFGNALYKCTSDFIKTGKLPCGCSRTTKWSAKQWEVLVKRKCRANNSEFEGFVSTDKVNQNSKLKLKCNVCGNKWETCSINNLLKDRTCPVCANNRRAKAKVTSDGDWIKRFRETGLFPESQYSFSRVSEFSREWEVTCSICGTGSKFIADRSNLVAGKVPCDCSCGGGFDVDKVGYFYILICTSNIGNFVKYGITNFPKRRIVDHKRTLRSIDGTIVKKIMLKSDGHTVLNLESHLKRTIPSVDKSLCCFKEETCYLEQLETLLGQCLDSNLKLVIT